MDPMLESFIQESRENLEAAGHCFLELEKKPGDVELLNDLFRSMHTIKGSSGLFDIPALTRVVHAAEDVLDIVRSGGMELTPEHIDLFLDCMDQVGAWLDDLETSASLPKDAEAKGQELSSYLRELLSDVELESDEVEVESDLTSSVPLKSAERKHQTPEWIRSIPDVIRRGIVSELSESEQVIAIDYRPDEQCFFSGADPVHTVQGLPGLKWFSVQPRKPWDDVETLDPFHCNLDFRMLVDGEEISIREHLRYVAEEISLNLVPRQELVYPIGEFTHTDAYEAFLQDARAALVTDDLDQLNRLIGPMVEVVEPTSYQASALSWMAALLESGFADVPLMHDLVNAMETGEYSTTRKETDYATDTRLDADANRPDKSADHSPETVWQPSSGSVKWTDAGKHLFETQLQILTMPCPANLLAGRIASTINLLTRLFEQMGLNGQLAPMNEAGARCEALQSSAPLYEFLQQVTGSEGISAPDDRSVDESEDTPDIEPVEVERRREDRRKGDRRKYNRRSSDSEAVEGDLAKTPSNKVLRVDQARIDTLMDLVGELVVAKNSLPFLAKRAEEDFGIRELAKEIKAQYAVINRLSDELQSAMMAVRMVPVSSVFQRFPRLVRDLSRKLGKDIRLVMEGEDTEADKNVIENLADPLIHLVRNSLDHGIESPAERREAGKPEQGTLILRAIPKDDQVIIEIVDDGKGIDPNVIKQKAYEKGIIDEAQLESISDQEAIELIFAAGLSSKEEASDLSGRGVGMDVVRTAVAESGGSVSVSSELGKGSKLSLALPLSMAVTRVMMIEVADQTYGISMEVIRETVRVPSASIERIKQDEAIVLRNKLIPLRRMRKVLGLPSNAQPLDEEAVLIVSLAGQEIGLIIDEFQEGIDIIQKPLEGVMEAYPMYAGATLLGDGRVLLILDLKELVG